MDNRPRSPSVASAMQDQIENCPPHSAYLSDEVALRLHGQNLPLSLSHIVFLDEGKTVQPDFCA